MAVVKCCFKPVVSSLVRMWIIRFTFSSPTGFTVGGSHIKPASPDSAPTLDTFTHPPTSLLIYFLHSVFLTRLPEAVGLEDWIPGWSEAGAVNEEPWTEMAVNLSKNGAALMAAYKEVVDGKTDTNWWVWSWCAEEEPPKAHFCLGGFDVEPSVRPPHPHVLVSSVILFSGPCSLMKATAVTSDWQRREVRPVLWVLVRELIINQYRGHQRVSVSGQFI